MAEQDPLLAQIERLTVKASMDVDNYEAHVAKLASIRERSREISLESRRRRVVQIRLLSAEVNLAYLAARHEIVIEKSIEYLAIADPGYGGLDNVQSCRVLSLHALGRCQEEALALWPWLAKSRDGFLIILELARFVREHAESPEHIDRRRIRECLESAMSDEGFGQLGEELPAIPRDDFKLDHLIFEVERRIRDWYASETQRILG